MISDLNSNDENSHDFINIVLFGPAGAGKSSFYKTLKIAYEQNFSILNEKKIGLIIQDMDNNEGTKKFSKFIVKDK